MKLLTFYMDGGVTGANLQQRLDSLGEIVRAKKPEFVALQNVAKDAIKRIQASVWGSRYKVTQRPYTFETRNKPTTVLLSSYPSEDKDVLEYDASPSAKVLLKGYYIMYDKQKTPFVICVATTSLEQGLKASEMREKQLNEACLNMEADDSFIMGGFGLDNDIDGELTLEGGWEDAWLEIPGNSESTGYTYNPEKNPLIKEDPFGPGRPDRLFYKTRHYKLDSVELVGNIHPDSATASATVSTHYGLLTQFSSLDTMKPKAEPPILSVIFKRTEWSVQFQESNVPEKKSEESIPERKWSVQFQESNQ